MKVLVVGKAKTGTTIISKTIEKSIGEKCEYYLEPKEICFFERDYNSKIDNIVVKIIFEHWNDRPRMRNSFINNEAKLKFDKIVAILRDPRDEMISRLMYLVKPISDSRKVTKSEKDQWIEVLNEKEESPSSISFLEMCQQFDKIFKTNQVEALPRIVSQPGYSNVLNNNKGIHVLKYEEFIENKITKLESYLGFELVEERSVGELDRTRRSQKYNNWKNVFIESDVEYYKNKIKKALEYGGYDDWELERKEKLDSTEYSLYIDKLLMQ